MGLRFGPASDRGRAASPKAGVSWYRCHGLGKGPHRGKTHRFGGAREADAFSLFARSIARNSPRDERAAKRRKCGYSARKTRSSGVVRGRAELGLFRSPDVRTRPVHARQRRAGMVDKSAARSDFTRIFAGRVAGTLAPGAPFAGQGRAARSDRFSGSRQLDGR